MARQRAQLIDAHRHLDGRDPILDLLMSTHGPARLPSAAPASRRFHDLAESIAYQQLNGTAAATIWGRVRAAAGEDVVTPQRLLDLGTEPLRAAGLSGSKARSMLDLSARVASGEIALDRIGRLDDEAVIASLVPVWGIGRWTAQMFLMFTLGRIDVWPVGDYGVRAGYARAWGLPAMPKENEMHELGAPFAGARSLVAWYCWRAADSGETGRS
ncbi:MAG: DNA-3-methyladenine glycosylase 2 family protein [Acidimicrobiales bacterium]